MCTVTVVPVGRMVRLACNRDELHLRPAALPPRVGKFGDRRAVLPIDPASEGTWVAGNDAGLAMTLLNVNLPNASPTTGARLQSRGAIIPSLLHCNTPLAAASAALALDPARFAPFRLVFVNLREVVEVLSDGKQLRLEGPMRPLRPRLFTSSSLGDLMVEGMRRPLFDAFFDQPGDWLARQDEFHRHRWPTCPHLSVCMTRDEARTVSHVIVSITPERITLNYHPDAPDQRAEVVSISLNLAARGAA